jgi:type IV secretion system protein TrbB
MIVRSDVSLRAAVPKTPIPPIPCKTAPPHYASALLVAERGFLSPLAPLTNSRRLAGSPGEHAVSRHAAQSEAVSRGARMLRTALGADVAAWLADPAIVEIMLNPDGRLWIDRLAEGLADTGARLAPAEGERIIRLVAHHVGADAHAARPRVSAELPESGERFEGLLPPVAAAPTFAIRKLASVVFSLEDYVRADIMSPDQADALRQAVADRRNILVAGGTSTGKTTLTNALLAEIARSDDRILILEDTRELQCAAENVVALRTKDGVVALSDLVRSSLRLRPDRILIGEVRGPEALDLIKAWGTGHPGGVGTIHAGSALGALRRLEQLIQEAVITVPRALIAETIDLIAVLVRDTRGRRLSELARVEGLTADGDFALGGLAAPPDPSPPGARP